MVSPRAPLFVFFAAFLTFLIAFATLVGVIKPEMDRRKAAQEAGTQKSADALPAVASLAPPAPAPKPVAPSPAPAVAATAKDKRAEPKSTSVEVDVAGRVVDARGTAVAHAQVHILVASKGKGEAGAWPLLTKPVAADGTFKFVAAIPPNGAFLLATAPGYVRSDTKSLAAGSASIDAGSLALKNGGSLRVRVSGDEAGKLAGAEVSLLDRTEGPADLAPQGVSAVSGDDGIALLRGIDRGAYRLRVRAADHADGELDWRFDGTGRNGTEEVAVVLLPLRAWVAGTALDLDRNPVTQGEVVLRLAQSDPPSEQAWRGPLDAQGQFRIGPLPRGSFSVEIVAPGMVQKTELFAESDGESVELLVEHGGTVIGHVACADAQFADTPRISVWRIDPNGRTQPVDGAYRAEAIKNTLKFRVDGLGPGRYYVRAAADGFAPGRSKTFTLGAGETSPELEIALGDGGGVTGKLVDSRGAAIRGAHVTMFEGTAPPPPALADHFPADAHTNVASKDDGHFTLNNLSPGPVVIVIEATGQAARTIGPLLIAEGQEVRLGAVALGGGTILSATVEGARGKPLAFGCGLLVASDGSVRVPFVADEEGNFCARGLLPGDYVLTALDGTTGRTEITLRSEETGRVQFTVERR